MKRHTGSIDALTQYRIDFDADEVFKEMAFPSLTKEDFWDRLKVTCPDAVQSFCNWIDEYKQVVNWEKLFNYGSPHYANQGWHHPKFHDLPFTLQYGILCEYFSDLISGKYLGSRGFSCPRYNREKLDSTVDEILMLFIQHQGIISLVGKDKIWPK